MRYLFHMKIFPIMYTNHLENTKKILKIYQDVSFISFHLTRLVNECGTEIIIPNKFRIFI